MWDRKQLKTQGKLNFKKNYWSCVLVAIILQIVLAAETTMSRSSSGDETTKGILQSLSNIPTGILVGGFSAALIIAILLEIFVRNMLIVGGYRFFINNGRTEKGELGDLVSAYKEGRFLQIFATMFLRDLFTILWSLLLIVPGIIKSYSYRMVPFILADQPEVGPTEAITMSRQMMNGHKMNTFILDLSFIGWMILSCLTFGLVGVFYYNPYKYATNAELYEALK